MSRNASGVLAYRNRGGMTGQTAKAWLLPAAIAVTPLPAKLGMTVCSLKSSPHATSVPLVFSARLKQSPAAMAATPLVAAAGTLVAS